MKRKPKKSRRKSLDDMVQAAARAMVIARDRKCVVCGRSDGILQGGHLISRRKASVRWDERNLYCQCSICNGQHRYHQYPLYAYALSVWGEKQMQELFALANTTKQWKRHELEEKEAEFYRKADFYEGVAAING